MPNKVFPSDSITICQDLGLVNDPSHWFNWVDINCDPYTYYQLIVFATGCLMWVIAYGIMLRNAIKFKFIEMAAVAGISNFAWEILWGTIFNTDMGQFFVWTYRAWLIFDLFIVYHLFKYGHKQCRDPLIRANFKWLLGLAGIFWLGIYGLLYRQGYDTSIGSVSAYICQFTISILCLYLIHNVKTLYGFSWNIAWLRSIGTGLVSLFMISHYPDNYFIQWLCLFSWICDGTYMIYFWKRMKREGIPVTEPTILLTE